MRYYSLSDVGKRASNQDAVIASEIAHETFLFAVADGMGGTGGGERASNEVITIINEDLQSRFDSNEVNKQELKQILKEVVAKAQNRLNEIITESPELDGMGTTLIALLIHKGEYAWCNIGDSRLYMVNEEKVVQLSKDHSYVEDFKEETGEEPSEAMLSQYGHMVTRVIDGSEDEPTLYPKEEDTAQLADSDAFLLCSDGLLPDRMTDGSFIPEHFYANPDLRVCAENMVVHAIEQGSTDNISVILIDVNDDRLVSEPDEPKDESLVTEIKTIELSPEELKPQEPKNEEIKTKKSRSDLLLLVSSIFLIVLIVVATWLYLDNKGAVIEFVNELIK